MNAPWRPIDRPTRPIDLPNRFDPIDRATRPIYAKHATAVTIRNHILSFSFPFCLCTLATTFSFKIARHACRAPTAQNEAFQVVSVNVKRLERSVLTSVPGPPHLRTMRSKRSHPPQRFRGNCGTVVEWPTCFGCPLQPKPILKKRKDKENLCPLPQKNKFGNSVSLTPPIKKAF